MKEYKANKTLLSILRIIKSKCSGYPILLIAIHLSQGKSRLFEKNNSKTGSKTGHTPRQKSKRETLIRRIASCTLLSLSLKLN